MFLISRISLNFEVLFPTFYCNFCWVENIVVIPRTFFYGGSLNRGSTVLENKSLLMIFSSSKSKDIV